MTATLTFQLPEEQDIFQVAVDSGKWRATVQEMDEWLRGKVKHGEGDVSDYVSARETLHELLTCNGLSIYD
jgi:hypothetical protein